MAGAAALTVLVGLSRMYLGAHYVSDVVGGFAAGIVWLSACSGGLEVARHRRESHRSAQAGAERGDG
jgi:undecaprenyl-diphosphatase